MGSEGKYEQEIRCEVCKKLLGYAPYWRTYYRCVKCNKDLDNRDAAKKVKK